jgi:hypothetical protein
MASTRDISRTEQRIAEVDALQQTIEQLRSDLSAYGEALRQELAWLQEQRNNTPATPSQPAAARQPTPPPAARQPTPPPRQHEPAEADLDLAELEEAQLEEAQLEEEAAELEEAEEVPDVEEMPRPPRRQTSPFELDEPGPGEEDKSGGKPVSVLISDNTRGDETLTGWVIDRPPGGLKILCDEELHIGTVIGVRPNRDHPDAQWINLSVKGVRPERQSFVLTCQFVERPQWNALALFN